MIYHCLGCDRIVTPRRLTIDERYAEGRCYDCGHTLFRRVGETALRLGQQVAAKSHLPRDLRERAALIEQQSDPDAAKAAGMAAVEQSAGQGVDAAWRADAVAAARKLADQGEPFTAEDVVARVGRPAHHPNLVGALMNALKNEGVIEHAGFTKATRPESRARWIQVWRGRRAA